MRRDLTRHMGKRKFRRRNKQKIIKKLSFQKWVRALGLTLWWTETSEVWRCCLACCHAAAWVRMAASRSSPPSRRGPTGIWFSFCWTPAWKSCATVGWGKNKKNKNTLGQDHRPLLLQQDLVGYGRLRCALSKQSPLAGLRKEGGKKQAASRRGNKARKGSCFL